MYIVLDVNRYIVSLPMLRPDRDVCRYVLRQNSISANNMNNINNRFSEGK